MPHLQDVHNDTTGAASVDAILTASAGSLLVAWASGNVDPTGVSDPTNGAWTPGPAGVAVSFSGIRIGMWYMVNPDAGSRTVTAAFGGSGNVAINVAEFSGVNAADAFEDDAGTDGGGSAIDPGDITVAGPALIVFGAAYRHDFGDATVVGSYTPFDNFAAHNPRGGTGGWKEVDGSGSPYGGTAVTGSGSDEWSAVMAAFNLAGGGGGGGGAARRRRLICGA